MKRFPELDGLRGLWALLVILVHAHVSGVDWLIVFMDGFFSLSAFLITLGLMDDRSPSRAAMLGRFYLRRSARIFPAYYTLLALILLLVLAVDLAGPHLRLREHIEPARLLPYFFYLQFTHLLGHPVPEDAAFLGAVRYLQHTWSLAVEEQFYLIWGLLFFFARAGWLRALAAAAFIVAGIAVRQSGAVDSPLLLYRLDAFGYGALAAMAFRQLSRAGDAAALARAGRVLGAAGVMALLGCWTLMGVPQAFLQWLHSGAQPVSGHSIWSPATILSAFGCGATVFALACCSGARALALLRLGALRYAGRISYCLYLFHFPIVDLLLRHQHHQLHLGTLGNVAIVMALSIGTADLATRFFDRLQRRIVHGQPLVRGGAAEAALGHSDSR